MQAYWNAGGAMPREFIFEGSNWGGVYETISHESGIPLWASFEVRTYLL
jgi:hypothetical protein